MHVETEPANAHREVIQKTHRRIAHEYACFHVGGFPPDSALFWSTQRIVANVELILRRYGEPLQHKDGILVDAGCGNGQWSEIYAQRTKGKIIGVDFAEEMLQVSRERAEKRGYSSRLSLVHSDLRDVADHLERESADMIHMFGVIMHLENPEQVISRLLDVLKPGGVFVCEVPRRWSLSHITYMLFGTPVSNWGGKRRLLNYFRWKEKTEHYHFFNSSDVWKMCEKNAQVEMLGRYANSHIWVVGFPRRLLNLFPKLGLGCVLDWAEAVMSRLYPIPEGELLVVQKKKEERSEAD